MVQEIARLYLKDVQHKRTVEVTAFDDGIVSFNNITSFGMLKRFIKLLYYKTFYSLKFNNETEARQLLQTYLGAIYNTEDTEKLDSNIEEGLNIDNDLYKPSYIG
jgi:hypothetical protein